MFDFCILVRGANDVGSAVAHALFTAGYAVGIHETTHPTTSRRKMAFTDAIFDGRTSLEGVTAERNDEGALLHEILNAHQVIPVTTLDILTVIETLHPQILVDARMRKHQQPEIQRGLAELTIGLGPNFTAGETTDLVVESNWGESLGRVIRRGSASPLQGEPREIEGHARDRYVYTPVAGTFHTSHEVGDLVEKGQEVAHIDSTALFAPFTGTLRGLTHDSVPVSLHAKVIEVVPRSANAQVTGIGERPAGIAEGVIHAIQGWEAQHVR